MNRPFTEIPNASHDILYWGSLNILREARAEQARRREDFLSARPVGAKQKTARRVHPLRRIFVTNDRKDSADSSCEEFLEVPYYK